jgi:hypothetical protein
MMEKKKFVWTNDSWLINWKNADELEIKGPSGQYCIIDGGDFENCLSALCAVKKTRYDNNPPPS